jgi:hypothetical protein
VRINASIGAGRRIEHHRALVDLDKLVSRAQRPPLTRYRIIAPHAKACNLVIKLNL